MNGSGERCDARLRHEAHCSPLLTQQLVAGYRETLDCRVYSLAALEVLNPNFERLAENMAKEPIEMEPEPLSPIPTTPKENRPAPRRRQAGGGFVDAWR